MRCAEKTSNYIFITFMYLIYAPKEVYSGGKNLFSDVMPKFPSAQSWY